MSRTLIRETTGGRVRSARNSAGSRIRSVRLAAGQARGGPDHSDLGVRGIRGIFYDALESAPRAWAREIGIYIPSDALTEDHRWLGAPPKPREHIGGLQAQPMLNFAKQVTNRDFESTLPFSTHDMRRDKTGQFPRKVGEYSAAIEDHWNDLGVETIETNGTCYDGQALFSATHSSGSSGTQSNLLTSADLASLNVVDPSRPDKDECGKILADGANYFFTYLDDAGRPTNQNIRKFLVLAHPTICPGFREALRAQRYTQGGSNDAQLHDWEYVLVPEPRLSAVSSFYMFRADDSASCLIVQEEVSPYLEYLGPGSEHEIKTGEQLWITKFTRACGEGQWRHGAKFTLD